MHSQFGRPMIVCSCNVIRALDSGADTVACIYRACGCAAQCGTCAAQMKAALKAARALRMESGSAD
jgi:bacterioferritin-associated ferredoxin